MRALMIVVVYKARSLVVDVVGRVYYCSTFSVLIVLTACVTFYKSQFVGAWPASQSLSHRRRAVHGA